jgi:hypothetical protein
MLKSKNIYKAHEKDIAKQLGGKRQPLSGALKEAKSDVVSDEFRIDCKYVHVKSFKLDIDTLRKITVEAFGQDLTPMLQVRFEQCGINAEKKYRCVDKDWAVIPLRILKDLIDK